MLCLLLWMGSGIGLVVNDMLMEDIPAKIWCDTDVKATMESVEEVFKDFDFGCFATSRYLQDGDSYVEEVRVPCPSGPQVAQRSTNARFCTRGGPTDLRLLSGYKKLMTPERQQKLNNIWWMLYGMVVGSFSVAAVTDALHTHWTFRRGRQDPWCTQDNHPLHPASFLC